jgi:ribosomal protein L11 methylase PrmA
MTTRGRQSAAVDSAGDVRRHGASFRDPAGFVFTRDGILYRQVNYDAQRDYDQLGSSGLLAELLAAGDLVPHQEVSTALSPDGRAYRVIRPEAVDFISYPYEWSFTQMKDAARLTLRLQKAAMARGMGLKDATPFNVVFARGRPIWIDTLSFEVPRPRQPWVAYRQFCEMFLAPLALMSLVDVRLADLLRSNLDGVPLDLTSALLPMRSRFKVGLLAHLHLHAAAQRRMRGRGTSPDTGVRELSERALHGVIESLERTVAHLSWGRTKTAWGDYYDATNYSEAAFAHKRDIIATWIERVGPAVVWDLGANDGTFSRLATSRGVMTVAFDLDPVAVEKNYVEAVRTNDVWMLPLRIDLSNPSAACGWANTERESLAARGPADLGLVLALVHHLAIGHNVPFDRIAAYLAQLCRTLAIEFVPKDDSQVQRMLASRVDIFDGYTQEQFERAFAAFFDILAVTPVRDSLRSLYLMRQRPA